MHPRRAVPLVTETTREGKVFHFSGSVPPAQSPTTSLDILISPAPELCGPLPPFPPANVGARFQFTPSFEGSEGAARFRSRGRTCRERLKCSGPGFSPASEQGEGSALVAAADRLPYATKGCGHLHRERHGGATSANSTRATRPRPCEALAKIPPAPAVADRAV